MKRLKAFWDRFGYVCVLTACMALVGVTAFATRRPQPEVKAPEVTRYAQPTAAPRAAAMEAAVTAAPTQQPEAFLMPCEGGIGMTFAQEALVYNETLEQYTTHDGVDILAEEGEAVRAVEDGTVTRVWEDALMGHCIEITHRSGYISTYASLHSAGLMEPDAAVSRGQVIGTVGTSAAAECAQGPHVHVELRRTRTLLNPMDFFEDSLD